MQYTNTLFLKEEEFNIEQNYRVKMRRFHNRCFNSWKIVYGLDIDLIDNTLYVNPGAAIYLSLEANTRHEVSREVILTERRELPLDLSKDGSVYICISYNEEKDFLDINKGESEKIQCQEKPIITVRTVRPTTDKSELILAKVIIEDGRVTDIQYDENETPIRTYTGAYGKLTLPEDKAKNSCTEPSIEVKRFGSTNGFLVNADTTMFSGKLILNNEKENEETKLPSIQGRKIGTLNGILVTADTTKFSGKLEVNGIVKANKFVGDGSELTGLKTGQWNDVAGGGIYYNAGKVGIGIDSPSEELEVKGTVKADKLEVKGDISIADGKILQDEWTKPILTSGWKDFGDPYNTSGYFIDKNGIVHLRGRVKDGQLNQPIFTLPDSFRPTNTESFSVASAAGTNTVEIQKDGSVVVKTGSPAWVSLDGINFRARR